MIGTAPNPLVLAGLKAIAYSAFGHQVSRRSEIEGSAVVFGVTRVIGGWIIGGPILIGALVKTHFSVFLTYAILTAPRFLLWMLWIYGWYPQRGGFRATVAWAAAGTAMSAVMDIGFLGLADRFSVFQTTWTWC